jgi:intein/homing endonuclease
MKIKKKEIVHYKGKVYDIKVSTPDMKYNINDIVVHNSAGGSLILFVLDITKIDPVRHNLIFERFTNPARCLPKKYFVMTKNGKKKLENLTKNDLLLNSDYKYSSISEIYKNWFNVAIEVETDEGIFVCSKNHKWIVKRNNIKIEIEAQHLKPEDEFLLMDT